MSDILGRTSPSTKRIGGLDENRVRREAKACNCKKSNCLKLYCECFANGVYCQVGKCNCISCFNNRENNEVRSQAVEATLERNPNSFRSKMFINDKSNDKAGKNSSNKVHKGCHCKKSNCLKKYCECFQAGIVCTDRCRCIACKNYEGSELRMEAAAKLELKEKQSILELQYNEMVGQRAGVSSFEGANLKHCSASSTITSDVSLDNQSTLNSYGIHDVSENSFLSDEIIQTECKLLTEKASDVMVDLATRKRKLPLEYVSNSNTPETSFPEGTPSDDKSLVVMKHAILDYFSENLRELIVQSLASTISENNCIQPSGEKNVGKSIDHLDKSMDRTSPN